MTSNTHAASDSKGSAFWFEDRGRDFAFYNGVPVLLSGKQWLFLMAMVATGFLAIALPIDWPGGEFIGPFIPAVVMPLIPLVALAYVAPVNWRAIFGKVGFRELRLMVGFALLNIIVSMMVGALVGTMTQVTSNNSIAGIVELDAMGQAAFFAKTLPQLFGEEVITILPFLAILYACTHMLGMGRKAGIIIAWLVSSVVFGLLHLPTYDWNFVQCVVIIGSARLMLSLPWIMTKNIWVSTGAHIINDWVIFGGVLVGTAMVAQS
ncbi:CPBP family intramembrane glutamic endopeptidase [Silanimonas sp.]|jgi:membrane protease YdiL (CAAX protease family)|uniref:CPBP family intramembrane glutamic endopeptidase n=1 Tax=Silanimonas sp. TaxID=1929290 RepID=UPI0037C83216